MVAKLNILALAIITTGGLVAAQTAGQAGAQANGGAGIQAVGATAQSTASAPSTSATQGRQQPSLAAGTTINAELNQSVDSKKAKAGDAVVARTTSDAKEGGKTVLSKGAKLVGHVTQATARANGDAESALAIQFDRAILKNGQEIPLAASIQALAAAQGATQVGGDDLEGGGSIMSGATTGGGGGRSAVGGVAGTAGAAAGGVVRDTPRVAQGATGAVNSTANNAASGLNANGQLTSNSRGVFGLNGLTLNGDTTSSGSLITSTGKNVHLEGGTRVLLVAHAEASASAQK